MVFTAKKWKVQDKILDHLDFSLNMVWAIRGNAWVLLWLNIWKLLLLGLRELCCVSIKYPDLWHAKQALKPFQISLTLSINVYHIIMSLDSFCTSESLNRISHILYDFSVWDVLGQILVMCIIPYLSLK